MHVKYLLYYKHCRTGLMLSGWGGGGGGGGALESLPKFLWRMAMKLPEFNLFSDKSARIFLILSSICPNFHGFPKFWGAVAPPLPPVSYAYDKFSFSSFAILSNNLHYKKA